MTEHRSSPRQDAPWARADAPPTALATRQGAHSAGGPGPAAPERGRAHPRLRHRLAGVDAARGLALIGMFSVHLLPAWDPETFEPTAQWSVFAGRSVSLFAVLAGVGLAFSSGGRTPHAGRGMAADRAGLVVRALLVAGLGLAINEVLPGNTIGDVPAVDILVYYGAFFLLAIPFLSLSAKALFAWAAVFAVAGPVLVHSLRGVLPAVERYNPALGDLVADPGTTVAQLLLTGTFPALPYLALLLTGMAVGRLDLSGVEVQARLLMGGATLGLLAWLASWALLEQAGGLDRLVARSPGLDEELVNDVLVWGPDPTLPTTTWWWLTVAGPYTNTPFALLTGLGSALAVLGAFLLLARTAGRWLRPLSAMGSMTLTVYSAHLLALATEVHYDRPEWLLVHVGGAVLFALGWRWAFGQGPLERVVAGAVRLTRRLVLSGARRAG